MPKTTMYQNRKKTITLAVDDVTRRYILALVGNLIGDRDRIPEMGTYKLTPDMIPDHKGDKELDTARTMLQLMYNLAEADLPPTQENLMPGLVKVYGEEAESRYWLIFNKRGLQDTDPAGMVSSYAFYLADWIAYRKMELAVDEMRKAIEEREGNAETLHAQLADILLQAAPQRRSAGLKTATGNLDEWSEEMEVREHEADEKGSVGPLSPFPRLNRLTASLRKGELDLWSAKTGFGKSTIAWLLAEHAAWKQGRGYNVLLFAFEQYPVSIVERYMAQSLGLTTLDFRNLGHLENGDSNSKVFRMSDPEWREKIQQVRNRVAKMESSGGKIVIIPASGWGPYEIEVEVAKWAAKSQAEGRDLYCIYDYYDLINPKGLEVAERKTTATLAAITDFLRDGLGQRYGIYTTAFAQDSVDTDYMTRQMPFNGQRIYQRSQRYVRIERKMAETQQFAMRGDGLGPAVDSLGRPIKLHDVGQADSNSLLHVIKANDGEQGYIPVRFWNGRFMVDEQKLSGEELLDRVKAINEANRYKGKNRD